MTATFTALHHHSFRAMDCEVNLWLAECSGDQARDAFRVAETVVHETEAALSRFRSDSELSRVNAAAGSATVVSPMLAEVLGAALRAARTTDGLFDPTVLPALRAAGYDRPFAELAGTAVAPAGQAVLSAGCWRAIEFDPQTRTLRLPPGGALDLGGIAKGWLADRLVARLAGSGPALADVGGDIATAGRPYGERGWAVGVADPHHPEQDLVLLALAGQCVATSGRDHRRWRDARGGSQHHIIDPRTCRPAATDALTVTVIAPTAAEAEVLAKVALLLGSDAGAAWLWARHVAGLVVREDGALVTTRSFHDYEWAGVQQ